MEVEQSSIFYVAFLIYTHILFFFSFFLLVCLSLITNKQANKHNNGRLNVEVGCYGIFATRIAGRLSFYISFLFLPLVVRWSVS
ncbi:hypothetical protein B0T21DRAFT_100749 [Apiosordaria backusii]|uniref:Uncharacterized protein n=1 Tax=Apiosordaria backusii TaxID=314023 RepID=A0AA40ETK8_9PEZI|nr:hypothetical protein B0T21DRAFT_100749 [Apiosordaria backusii]